MPDDQTGRPNVRGRTSGVNAFWWTLAEFCDRELLRYVFADVEDERNQYTMVVHQVAARLSRTRPRRERRRGLHRRRQIRTWPDLIEFITDKVTDETNGRGGPARSPGSGPSTRSSAACGPPSGT